MRGFIYFYSIFESGFFYFATAYSTMDESPLGPMIAIPYASTVDANQLHRDELNTKETLNKVSAQTAAAIGTQFLFFFLWFFWRCRLGILKLTMF